MAKLAKAYVTIGGQSFACSSKRQAARLSAAVNAAVQAACNDLLEPLKWFVDDIDGRQTVMLDFDANVERARAALAKAEGRAHA